MLGKASPGLNPPTSDYPVGRSLGLLSDEHRQISGFSKGQKNENALDLIAVPWEAKKCRAAILGRLFLKLLWFAGKDAPRYFLDNLFSVPRP